MNLTSYGENCNPVGNPQVLGQKPVTFFRQVLSICDYPEVRLFNCTVLAKLLFFTFLMPCYLDAADSGETRS